MEEVAQAMKPLALVVLLALALSAAPKRTFTGVITDTMCGTNHAMMKARSEPDCVKACIKAGGPW